MANYLDFLGKYTLNVNAVLLSNYLSTSLVQENAILLTKRSIDAIGITTELNIMNKEVDNYITKSSEAHQQILNELRQIILSVAPNVVEQIKWSRPVFAIEKDFCYFKTTKKHVTLGFFDFAKVVTKKDKIEGTGKAMRHIKLTSVSDIEELEVRKMVMEVVG